MKSFVKKILNYIASRKPYDVNVTNISLSSNELLKERTALITGGTSGIGFSIAEKFLNAGAKVIITGRNKTRVDEAVRKLKEKTGKEEAYILGLKWDVTYDDINSKYEELISHTHFRNIDILVNNAGIGGGNFNTKEEEFDKIIETNLKSSYFLGIFFGKLFVKEKIKGNILFISSSSALRPASSPYMISKWGIRGITLGLAKILIKSGITVNAIAPGPTATPMLMKEGMDLKLESSPIKRYILPEEIANMAVILVSEMGRSIVGETIYMTGGTGLITYDDLKYPDWR